MRITSEMGKERAGGKREGRPAIMTSALHAVQSPLCRITMLH